MRILWIKGSDNVNFNSPMVFLILGVRGSGKSSILETYGELYLQQGHKILDLFGSRDGESLAWLRSPYAKDRKILLIHGDNTTVKCSWDCKPASQVSLQDIEHYDLTISSSPLYSDPGTEFLSVARLTDLVYKRLSWDKIIYCLVREASNLYFSRLKISRSQTMAKAEEIYLLREARHCGVSMGLDTLKFTSVDLDVRAVCDYLMFKSLGLLGLPHDLEWLYGYFSPVVLRNMAKQNFIILSKDSSAGIGSFKEVEWHKQPKESILKDLDINVNHGEPLKEAEDHGTFFTVSDSEHSEIIEAYASGLSMNNVSKASKRSARTVLDHIHKHDDSVVSKGYCEVCERIKSQYSKINVMRNTKKK